jgi:hypothetical protein
MALDVPAQVWPGAVPASQAACRSAMRRVVVASTCQGRNGSVSGR